MLPVIVLSQNDKWPVKAITDSGNSLPVNLYFNDGSYVPVYAIFADGNDHFMDVKGVRNGEKISIKLISSNDVLVPVKGVSTNGDIYDVKAVNENGKILDVKGVSRDGNTLNLAAVSPDGRSNMPLMAVSPQGVERPVKGVKFRGQNVEMEFGDIQVIGHVKALPIIEVGDVDSQWDIVANSDSGEKMRLLAISEKGKEYPIYAEMEGHYPVMMNVRAQTRMIIHIKLVKNDNGIILQGIDEIGRLYKVRAVTENGDSYKVLGGKTTGNVTPIFVAGKDGKEYPVKAVSSKGHEFDVRGVKVKEDDVEDIISGLNVWVRYYSHVKAMAPAK